MRVFRFILFLTCCLSWSARADDAVSIYWPLNDGDIKHFSGTNGLTDLLVVQTNARFAEKIYVATNGAPAVTNYGGSTTLLVTNGTVVSYGATLGSNTLTFNPAWTMLNNNVLTSGGTVGGSFTATIGSTNAPITAQTIVRSVGNVTVPAGLFRDCWSVQLTLTALTTKVLVQDYILAPHVGIIQIGIVNSNFIQQGWQSLTGGTIGGQNVSAFTNKALLRIVKKPVAQTVLNGGTAKFTATGAGNDPLSYQWLRNSVNLTNDDRISGATTTNLTIAPAQYSDAGSYALVVSDLFGNITSSSVVLKVNADTVKPTVTITSPLLNTRSNITSISGTAADNVRVQQVVYWFTNINNGVKTISPMNTAQLAGTNVMKMTWSSNVTLLPGSNVLVTVAQDYDLKVSAPLVRPFFNKVPSAFTLTKSGDGDGAFTGKAAIVGDVAPTNNIMLNIGEGYAITATPNTNSFLTNWTGSLGTITNNTISFIMEPGFSLQANFVTNHFIHMAGTYNGLFSAGDAPAVIARETAGALNTLTVSGKGVYSGKLLLAGATYAVSGTFNLGGQATNIITRTPAAGGKITLALNLNWDSTNRNVTGSVSGTNGGDWTSPLLAIANGTNTSSYQANAIFSFGDPVTGLGYMLVTNKAGVVTMTGALADGVAFSQTMPLNEVSTLPFYATPYGNTGLLMGWLSFDRNALTNTVPGGYLMWIRKPGRTPLMYTNGFTNVISVQGSTWTNVAKGVAALPFTTDTPGKMTFGAGGLTSGLAFNIAVTTNNVLTKISGSTNSLTGTIDPKTGLTKITFGNGAGKATTTAQGVSQMVDGHPNSGGAFLGKTNAGLFIITDK